KAASHGPPRALGAIPIEVELARDAAHEVAGALGRSPILSVIADITSRRPCANWRPEQVQQIAETSHSITSSARASSVCGTVRPSALIAFWLTASSNLTGCSTGSSASFVMQKCTYPTA